MFLEQCPVNELASKDIAATWDSMCAARHHEWCIPLRSCQNVNVNAVTDAAMLGIAHHKTQPIMYLSICHALAPVSTT